MTVPPAPNRLILDGEALIANWRLLDQMSGPAACGAAVKADGYGLGADAVVKRLAKAGCTDFFVATWAEAAALADLRVDISVLHGVGDADLNYDLPERIRPVLNTPIQVRRWQDSGGGPCDVMVDTGMNRLGISPEDALSGLLDGVEIVTLMSHLACADEDVAMNARQRDALTALRGRTTAKRMSLANSAGIALGADYAFDLTRPGLALYGGVPRDELTAIRQVVFPQAQVLQQRTVAAGGSVGYNALWTADIDTPVAIINIGYADGYWRGFTNSGGATTDEARLPVIGRVSMDLVALDATAAPDLAEGNWITLDYRLPDAAAASGMSQYELITGLGDRFDRVWRG